jgi:hypothetical protein
MVAPAVAETNQAFLVNTFGFRQCKEAPRDMFY